MPAAAAAAAVSGRSSKRRSFEDSQHPDPSSDARADASGVGRGAKRDPLPPDTGTRLSLRSARLRSHGRDAALSGPRTFERRQRSWRAQGGEGRKAPTLTRPGREPPHSQAPYLDWAAIVKFSQPHGLRPSARSARALPLPPTTAAAPQQLLAHLLLRLLAPRPSLSARSPACSAGALQAPPPSSPHPSRPRAGKPQPFPSAVLRSFG